MMRTLFAFLTLLLLPLRAIGQDVPYLSASTTATYQVTFASTWSSATHPQGFPSNPHFSGLIGATHKPGVSFWSIGTAASPGIKSMAETGSKQPLNAEINAAIQAGTAASLLDGGGIGVSPGSVSLTFTLTDEAPLVTLVSMIAPSPDWFVGVSALPLYTNGAWAQDHVVTLYAYDAGTDSGTGYTSSNQVTSPPENIHRITTAPFVVNNATPALGTFTFTRLSVTGVEDEAREIPSTHVLGAAYPNPFNPEATFTLQVREAQQVRIAVYDLTGRRVETLFSGLLSSGVVHRFALRGERWPSGVYLYRVEGTTFRDSRVAVLLK